MDLHKQHTVSHCRGREVLKTVLPLYKQSDQLYNFNNQYCRTRRFNAAGKYRIGPLFITKRDLLQLHERTPGYLKLPEEKECDNLPEIGLLTYLWWFTKTQEDQEIDLNFIKVMLASGVDINLRDAYGQSTLHATVRDWHADVSLFVIRQGADVNIQDTYGRTPLHLAATLNHADAVNILLENGADPNILTFTEDQTPMHYAARYNSSDALRVLINFQKYIIARDYLGRTVLFIAAEMGSKESAQMLLDNDAPIAVFDKYGNSALAHMIEKIPTVAFHALGQYVQKSSRDTYNMYLSYLEGDVGDANADKSRWKSFITARVATTPLEVITQYDNLDIIMHPVVQKSIDIKWKLFGRKDTMKHLFLTCICLICWFVLAYFFGEQGEFYYSGNGGWRKNGWKLIFEIIIILFALYYFLKEYMAIKQEIRRHKKWITWKENLYRPQYVLCHPTWAVERESVLARNERSHSVPSLAGKNTSWFVYECVAFLLMSVVIVTRILATQYIDDNNIFGVHKCVFGVTMIFSSVRLLKICVRIRCIFVFMKMAFLVVKSFAQILFLYIQLYIPFVAAFWLMFGVSYDYHDLSHAQVYISIHTKPNHTEQEFSLYNMFLNVYGVSFGKDTLYHQAVDSGDPAFQSFISIYHMCSSAIALCTIIAFITAKFKVYQKRYVAEASLLQAYIVLRMEANMSKEEKSKLEVFYRNHCSPYKINMKIKGSKRDAKLNHYLIEKDIKNIVDRIRKSEERFQKIHADKQKEGMILYESIRQCSSLYLKQIGKFREKLDMNEIGEREKVISEAVEDGTLFQ